MACKRIHLNVLSVHIVYIIPYIIVELFYPIMQNAQNEVYNVGYSTRESFNSNRFVRTRAAKVHARNAKLIDLKKSLQVLFTLNVGTYVMMFHCI